MPVSFSIPGQLPEFNEWLSGGIARGVQKGSLSAALRVVELITSEIIPDQNPPPVATSAYRAAWHAEPTKEGADVVNTMPYASIIEGGARAENIKISRLMIEALAKWVMMKGLVGKPARAGSGARQQQDVQARSIAWAIAVHMKKVGIFNRNGQQGLNIGQKAIIKGRAMILGEIANGIFEELGKQ